jgi:hypothetical protein
MPKLASGSKKKLAYNQTVLFRKVFSYAFCRKNGEAALPPYPLYQRKEFQYEF